LDEDLTLLFEIIYPENRVVVDYKGWQGLVLIGARSRSTGRDLYYRELEVLADRFGFPLPKHYAFNSIRDILNAAAELSANEEGWVVRFADNERVKIKGEAYRLAHRIMTGVTFNRVLEAVREGIFEKMIEGVPDEFLGQIRVWRDEIQTTVEQIKAEIAKALAIAPMGSQKEFALWVQANYPKAMQSYLFAAKAGKPLEPLIYKLAFEQRPNSDQPQSEQRE
jgi:RNA ligase